MNDFEKMCKELEDREKCNRQIYTGNNEYIFAKRAVDRYVNGERNRVLKIKAEAKFADWWVYTTTLLSIFAVFVSILTLLCTIINGEEWWYGSIILTVLAAFICLCFMINKYHSVSKWRGYIMVAAEELEKEIDQGLNIRKSNIFSDAEHMLEIEDDKYERKCRQKASFNRNLKESLIRIVIYLLYGIVMVPIATFLMDVETKITPELIVIMVIIDILAIALILFNLWGDTSNDKLLYAIPNVIPELQNVAIEAYEKELRKMDVEKLIQMYTQTYEWKRKKIDISNRTLIGGFLTIILPVVFAKLIESNSTITVGIAFLFVVPLLLELAIGTILSFQNESIRNTKCLEKQLQDKYICKILEEEWGVKLENI